jgi:pyridoxal phosphate enzyme (YggS family)
VTTTTSTFRTFSSSCHALDEAAVAGRLGRLRELIAQRATRGTVTVCAVTKGFGPEAVRIAHRLGCEAIGENYAQEAITKLGEVGREHPPLHFIGRLQSNKVRSLASVVAVWQSVDRVSVVEEIAKRAPRARIYVQVNATGEPDKGGCPIGDTALIVNHARSAGLVVEGLMTVGPTVPDDDHTRRVFAEVRRLADDLGLAGCSMGMSGDLEIALAEGATLVRVGSAIFGERP